MIIDTHVHLGDIFGFDKNFRLEERNTEAIHPGKPNTYEQMGFRNIYLGRLNYLFKPLIVSAAHSMTRYGNLLNLEESMKTCEIDSSVVLALEPYVPTESILAVCAKNKNLIPFCSVHPRDEGKKEKLRRYINSGCRGLKIHPVFQEVSPDDPATLELLEEVRSYNIPVLFHTGWGSIGRGEFGSPSRFKRILDSFPKMTFIFAHIGLYEPFAMLDLIEHHPNVSCDTSFQPAGIVRRAIDRLGEDRLMLGSDWPYCRQDASLKIILKVTDGKSKLRDKILSQNAMRIIKI